MEVSMGIWLFVGLFVVLVGGYWLLLKFFSRKNCIQDWFDKKHAQEDNFQLNQKALEIINSIQNYLDEAVKSNREWGESLMISRCQYLNLYVQNDRGCIMALFVYPAYYSRCVHVKAECDGKSTELWISSLDDQKLSVLLEEMTTYLQKWKPQGTPSSVTFD